jgi:hypothetical protein
MPNFFREGFLALQQHFQGQGDLDAVDGLKAGIVVGILVGLVWLIAQLLFALL